MKKLIYILTIFISAGFSTVNGQNHGTVKLDKGSKLLKAISVNNGLVLFTGNEFYFTKKLDWKISYYAPHLTTRYSVPVPNPSIKSLNNCYFVVSPSGANVYFIRRGAGGLLGSRNTQNIMHIDSSGFSNTMPMKGELKYDQVNVVFADDTYLYYVTKEKDKTTHNKHAFPKLQFVRVGIKDKSVSKVMLALPDPDPDATEWSYLGHTKVVSYFVSRTLNDETYKSQKFRVAVIDHDGKLQDDFKIDVDLKNGRFLPEYNYCGTEGTHEVDNHNIKVTTYSNTTYTGNGTSMTTTTVVYSPYPEAYGNIMLDPYTNGFYVYGIAGPSGAAQKSGKHKKKSDDPTPTNYFVFKFDQDGKQVWASENKLIGIGDYFKDKAGFSSRQVTLSYGAQGNLRLQAFAAKDVSTNEINAQTGAYVTGYANSFDNPVRTIDLGSCHKAGDKMEINKFLSKTDKGDYSQLNFRMLTNNVVVQNYFHDARLEMYDFGDE